MKFCFQYQTLVAFFPISYAFLLPSFVYLWIFFLHFSSSYAHMHVHITPMPNSTSIFFSSLMCCSYLALCPYKTSTAINNNHMRDLEIFLLILLHHIRGSSFFFLLKKLKCRHIEIFISYFWGVRYKKIYKKWWGDFKLLRNTMKYFGGIGNIQDVKSFCFN